MRYIGNNRLKMPMNESCTLNELVLYLHNETTLLQTVEVQNAIDNDEETAEIFDDLKKISGYISQVSMRPPRAIRESILNYARLTAAI